MSNQLNQTEPYVVDREVERVAFLELLGIDEAVFGAINPHADELKALLPGVPLNVPQDILANLSEPTFSPQEDSTTPIDWAKSEWEKGIKEYTGPGESNLEIEKYHRATGGVAPDDVAWCSSFVNWCVEQSGLTGTGNKAARSWHRWGEATTSPSRGDIVVFKRKDSTWKGHVGFFWEDEGDNVRVLGGNQSNAVRISTYPKNGTKYALLSYRKL